MEKLVLAHYALLAGICFILAAVRWIQRKAADMRGHRLPPMRLL